MIMIIERNLVLKDDIILIFRIFLFWREIK